MSLQRLAVQVGGLAADQSAERGIGVPQRSALDDQHPVAQPFDQRAIARLRFAQLVFELDLLGGVPDHHDEPDGLARRAVQHAHRDGGGEARAVLPDQRRA